jgi:hypothetical protein
MGEKVWNGLDRGGKFNQVWKGLERCERVWNNVNRSGKV